MLRSSGLLRNTLQIRQLDVLRPYTAKVNTIAANIPRRQQRKFRYDVHPEVENALRYRQPVVALESTIITHGMPHPQNINTALEVETLVRENGAVPATIAIIDGCIKVGLTQAELCLLAQKPTTEVTKCSRRDLPFVVAMQQSGGTTVAATMIIAHQVGIQIFATGGIGGVHRDGESTMDISADLMELGRTPVVVVCSGVKSILDIPRTLEYLETQGVCVASYNNSGGRFPDFYTRDSGCTVPYNLTTVSDAAKLITSWSEMDLESGILIGVPIPEQYAANKLEIDAAIEKATQKAKSEGISGKDVTPFILSAIASITKGKSLQANIALIKHNATMAAQFARELYEHQLSKKFIVEQIPDTTEATTTTNTLKPLVIGASILDLSFTLKDQEEMHLKGATYQAAAKQAAGGVGRNIAEGLFKLYGNVNLISAIGDDPIGDNLRQMMPADMQSHLIVDKEHTTSLCSLTFDHTGDCKLVLGNMDIHASITDEYVCAKSELFRTAPLIIMDSNLSLPAMAAILKQAQIFKRPVIFEPTDMLIAGKPFELPRSLTKQIHMITPNVHELKTIVESITGKRVAWQPSTQLEREELLREVAVLLEQIESHFRCILLTLGEHGVLLNIRQDCLIGDNFSLLNADSAHHPERSFLKRFYPAPNVQNIVNVSGAGDSFAVGFITALLQNHTLDSAVAMGFIAAKCALCSASAVPSKYFDSRLELNERHKEALETLKKMDIALS